MKRIEDRDDNTNQFVQLTLLSTEELAEMRRPSASRLRGGEVLLRKTDDGLKARHAVGEATQLRLPGF